MAILLASGLPKLLTICMKKILMLEDDPNIARFYKSEFDKSNYELLLVKDTKEAEEAVKKFKADLIFVDYGIIGDDKTGIDIIPILARALPKGKIVVLSNFSDSGLKAQAIKAGASDWLVKLHCLPKDLIRYVDNI